MKASDMTTKIHSYKLILSWFQLPDTKLQNNISSNEARSTVAPLMTSPTVLDSTEVKLQSDKKKLWICVTFYLPVWTQHNSVLFYGIISMSQHHLTPYVYVYSVFSFVR